MTKRVGETLHVTIRYEIERTSSCIADTEYSWPNMTEAEDAALREMLANLLVHEHGHLDVARKVLKRHGNERFTADTLAAAQKTANDRPQAPRHEDEEGTTGIRRAHRTRCPAIRRAQRWASRR